MGLYRGLLQSLLRGILGVQSIAHVGHSDEEVGCIAHRNIFNSRISRHKVALVFGQGDLVSILFTPRSHLITRVSPLLTYLRTAPDPPSGVS